MKTNNIPGNNRRRFPNSTNKPESTWTIITFESTDVVTFNRVITPVDEILILHCITVFVCHLVEEIPARS